MDIGKALVAAAQGKLIRRSSFGGNWHLRVIRPSDIDPNASRVPILRCCEGYPIPVVHHMPSLNAEDLLAEDWEIMDPALAVASFTEVEIIPWHRPTGYDEDED